MKITYKISIIFLVLILLICNSISAFAASEYKTGTLVAYYQSTNYTEVYLTKHKTAKLKIYAYNCYGNTVTKWESIHIKMTDTAGNILSEFDTKNNSTIQLGSDHSIYRLYVTKSFTETYDPTRNKKSILTSWGLKTTSNCTFNYSNSISAQEFSNSNSNTQPNNNNNNNNNSIYDFLNCNIIISPKHAPNMVVDISGGNKSVSNGNNVLIWGLYNSYNKSRLFKFVSVGNGWYAIKNVNSGLVLDVDCSNGNVLQYEYHGGKNQLWKLEDAGNGYYYIRCKETDIYGNACYLDVEKGNKNDGANVVVYHQNFSDNQKFKFTKVK